MSLRTSTTLRAFPPELGTIERLDIARDAGFDGVEVNLEPAEEYTLESGADDLGELRAAVEARGLAVSAVYSRQQWLYPLTSASADVRAQGIAVVRRLLWAAELLGTDAVLVLPGAVDNSMFAATPEIVPYDVAWTNAQRALRELVADAEQRRVHLAIENTWGKFLLSPVEFATFVDELDSPWAGVYFDIGNVMRTGFPEHWLPVLGPRVRRVHAKDFRLGVDAIGGFVGLLAGDVNWPAVREAVERIGYDSWVTAEVLPPYRYHGERLIYETSAALDTIFAREARVHRG
jgi:hexulose-6-phosphate isomerase